MKLNERIELILQQLSENMFEREHIIALSLLGALSGTNTFLLGAPGTAKSLISRKIAQAFEEPKYFEYLMNRFSTPEEVFGPVSIKALKEDKYTRKIENYLPNADFAFLDEIWKSSPAILNALLTLVNEKIFKNGDEIVHAPLKALVSASNEVPPDNQGLEALYDRFILRLIVEPIKEKDNFLNLISSKPTQVKSSIESNLLVKQDEWKEWQDEIHQITFNTEINNVILMIRKLLADLPEDKKVYVSDRRWQRAAYLLKAAAFFNGRREVLLSEIFLLKYCLWTKLENFEDVSEIVEKSIFNLGIDSGIDTSFFVLEKQRLDQEISTELYYTEDIYETEEIYDGKFYYPYYCEHRRKKLYIKVSGNPHNEFIYAIDSNGNKDRDFQYKTDGSGSYQIFNGYNRNIIFTPKVKYTRGSKKQNINRRLIDALLSEVEEIQKNFIEATEQVKNKYQFLANQFSSLFIAEKDLKFLLNSIEEQIKKLEVNIQDCGRLKDLCDN